MRRAISTPSSEAIDGGQHRDHDDGGRRLLLGLGEVGPGPLAHARARTHAVARAKPVAGGRRAGRLGSLHRGEAPSHDGRRGDRHGERRPDGNRREREREARGEATRQEADRARHARAAR